LFEFYVSVINKVPFKLSADLLGRYIIYVYIIRTDDDEGKISRHNWA